MARELTSTLYLVSIPSSSKYPPELINVLNVDYIQFHSESEVLIHFASGKTKLLKGDRAKVFVKSFRGN